MTLYSIILPTYNEKENLPIITWIIDEVMNKSGFPYELIIVDDNSPDGTGEVAKKLQSIFGGNKIILKPRSGKLGLGSAYLHGLKFAKGDFVIIMDADLSHHVGLNWTYTLLNYYTYSPVLTRCILSISETSKKGN
ncbi:unnamed protein product [Schistosoma margrebowiei]|uniref:Dolichol-phosphate mannosyltransferase subunit 1 n=1 Tax=Schistosoma margrebowiei TaxID=48269 RepID=A0A183M5Q1_9TREM|nr:unnamed protein product [Schistosoma margrebowiei]